MRICLAMWAAIAFALIGNGHASASFVVGVNNETVSLSGATVTVDGSAATWGGPAGARMTALGNGVDGTDLVGLTGGTANPTNDFYWQMNTDSFNPFTSPGNRLRTDTHRYAEIFYAISDDPNTAGTKDAFVGNSNRLRLGVVGGDSAFDDFPAGNDLLIPGGAGDHSFIVDLLSDDGVNPVDPARFDGQWNTFRYDFFNNDGNEGIVYTLDKVVFGNAVGTPGAGDLGDFNDDGNVDALDIDAYIGNLNVAATGDLAKLDLNADTQVTLADHEQLVTQLVTAGGVAGTALGDANLDGVVDVLGDAAALVNNLSQSGVGWAEGDFNADGHVDVLGDAAILVNNLGASNTPAGAVTTSAVPEPGSLSLLALVSVAATIRRRR